MGRITRRRGGRLALAVTTAALSWLAFATSAMADKPTSTTGSFVIGDQAAVVGNEATFWGAQWWTDNPLSFGPAPASFKGFADTASPQCGQQWTTRPGDSSFPPDTLDPTITVAVSSQITKSGPVISGDTVAIATIQVDPGYQSNPGHPGTGMVLSVVPCGVPTAT